jgi:hypothetical protein
MNALQLFSRKYILILLFSLMSVWLNAATITGTVQDSTGAVIPNAHIVVATREGAVLFTFNSDGLGHFVSPDLQPGKYSVRVSVEHFQVYETSIDVSETVASLVIRLSPAGAKEEITVRGKSRFANSDPVYQSLRNVALGASFSVENFTVKCDVATFELKQGTLTFLSPVQGVVTGAIFVGTGHFTLKPVTAVARTELNRRVKAEQVDEDFTSIVFR